MARRKRCDEAGGWFHVMNRGTARRTIFDERGDYRFFLACVAQAVRQGQIELLAFVLMRTHFHMLVRSLGGLSDAMRRLQLRHVRRFNRRHRRDGPLLRGRFLSRRVRTPGYARNVVRYIHENPVVAKLCVRGDDYEWSSAWFLASGRSPRWFTDRAVRRHGLVAGCIPSASEAEMAARADLVEARLKAPRDVDEDLLDISTPQGVLDWMRRKAELADGARTGLPAVGPRTLDSVLKAAYPAMRNRMTSVPGAQTHATYDMLRAGLLRDVSCCSYAEIGSILDGDENRAKRLVRLHRRCVNLLPSYAETAVAVVRQCLSILDVPGRLLPGTDRSLL